MLETTTSTLENLAARSGRLYSLPGVAMQVLHLTRNPHVDSRVLKECIENDPAISARILRVVNSSLFGLSREVSDLNQALALLGIKPLKLLVLGFSLPSGLFMDIESKTLLWYWKHSLTKAVACRELSQRLWRIPGDEAFLAGLFQDIGILLLFQQLGQPYARLLDRVVARGDDLCAIEKQVLGFSNRELSARLLEQWSFPESLCTAVAWHKSAGQTQSALPQIIELSELFAQLLADGRTSMLAEIVQKGELAFPRFDQFLEPLVLQMEVKVHELADIFSLALPDGLEYRDVLAEAHRQMTHITTEAAEDLVRSRMPEDPAGDDELLMDGLDALTASLAEACATLVDDRPPSEVASPTKHEPTAGSQARTEDAWPSTVSARSSDCAAPTNLVQRLTTAIAACRTARRAVSLLLVELTQGGDLLASHGPQETARLRKVLGKACNAVDFAETVCMPYAEFGYAMIFPGAERKQAIELANELVRTVRHLAETTGAERNDWLKLDVGVATVALPPKNFPPCDLLSGADRCLYASHASGGGVVKSIEIY